MSGRKISSTHWSVAAVVAIVFVASVFLFLRPAPEEVVGISDDGLVRASGLSRSSSETLVIERIDDVETSVTTAISHVYEVSLTSNGHVNDGELVMTIEQSESLSEIVLYTFDRETLSWVELPTLFDLASFSVSTSLDFTGSLLLVAGERE